MDPSCLDVFRRSQTWASTIYCENKFLVDFGIVSRVLANITAHAQNLVSACAIQTGPARKAAVLTRLR